MMTLLYSANAIEERVRDMAAAINKEYAGEDLVHAIVTLNGAFMFAADLIRHLNIPLVLHFAGAPSYQGSGSETLRINADALPPSFGNKPVILIEDIMDSGNTVGQLRRIIAERYASSIDVIALLKRQGGDGKLNHYAFTVPRGLFVVGYGMDLDGRYRELKDVHTLATASMSTDNSGIC